MNLHKHQLYLLEQHSESYEISAAIIRINTEGKYLIMKVGPGLLTLFKYKWSSILPLYFIPQTFVKTFIHNHLFFNIQFQWFNCRVDFERQFSISKKIESLELDFSYIIFYVKEQNLMICCLI